MIGIKKLKKRKLKDIIGRCDKVDLPDMELFDIDAKVDTGAYTSALNCSYIQVVTDDGHQWLEFIVLDNSHPAYNKKKFRVKEFTSRRIKNSFGDEEERYIITTALVVFGKVYKTEFTLSNRDALKFPILLGRKFLQHGYIVNVNRYNLSYKRKLKENEDSSIVKEPQPIFNQKISRGGSEKRS